MCCGYEVLCVVIIMLCVVSAADHFYLSVSIIGPALSTESRPNNASSRREREEEEIRHFHFHTADPAP